MSNSLDPDQARRFVGPDLGPNCLPRISADDTGRQRVKGHRKEIGKICRQIQTSHDKFLSDIRILCDHFRDVSKNLYACMEHRGIFWQLLVF